jgi:hypothetical protein
MNKKTSKMAWFITNPLEGRGIYDTISDAVFNVVSQKTITTGTSIPATLRFIGSDLAYTTFLEASWLYMLSGKSSSNPNEDALEKIIGKMLGWVGIQMFIEFVTKTRKPNSTMSIVKESLMTATLAYMRDELFPH